MTIPRAARAHCRLLAGGLLLLLGAGGCALPELAWQQADNMLIARADHWLDLEPPQEEALHARLQPWLRGVRRDRLDDYAVFLDRLADRVEPEMDLADARWASDRFDRLYAATVRSFLPVIAPTLAGLSPEQRQHLARRMQEANDEYRADFVEGRDRGMYAVAGRIIGAVERWSGPLDPDQHALVHRRARELPRTQPQWLRFRQRMQQRLLAQIERGAGAAAIQRTLERWWVEPVEGATEPVPGTRELRAGILRTLVALQRSLSPGQRAEARRRLHARAGTLRTLAATAD